MWSGNGLTWLWLTPPELDGLWLICEPQVVSTGEDMQETLEKEQKADEDMYDDLQCWCKDSSH